MVRAGSRTPTGPSKNAKARYFDPKLGRFLTQDSFLGQIDNPPSLHRYLYGYANPARYIDPTGHAPQDTQGAPVDELELMLQRARSYESDISPELERVLYGSPSSTVPEGEVKEEGWGGTLLRWIGEKYEAGGRVVRRWGRDAGEALFGNLIQPEERDAYVEQQLAALDYNPRVNLAEELDETVTDIGGKGGELGAELAYDAAIGKGAGFGAAGVVGPLGRGKRALKNLAREADEVVEAEAKAAKRASSRAAATTRQGLAREGRYEFPDQTVSGTPYVGQSGNIPRRLRSHEKAGRLQPGTETTTEVLGGKTTREISEHERIQELTGGVPARESSRVSNKLDPIGPRRRHLLEKKEK